jgi:ribosomal protein S12 methylthiotransferase accessory factor
VYRAYVYDPSGYAPSSHGYGAHLDPEVAMVRALIEAAQIRAILISGARDDIFHQYYTMLRGQTNRGSQAVHLESHSPTLEARAQPSQATPTFEEDIEILLKKLKRVGLEQVIVFDLSPPDWDISVVRAIVPGLEASFHRKYNPKQRAIAFAERKYTASVESQAGRTRKADTHLSAGGTP